MHVYVLIVKYCAVHYELRQTLLTCLLLRAIKVLIETGRNYTRHPPWTRI